MNFDYESIRDRILDSLRATASWASILPFSVNRRIIDAVASGIAEMGSYDEYLTREAKWDIAQNLSSLVLNSKFLGYDVHRKLGASGNVRISAVATFDSPPAKIIVIPKYTTFTNGGDISFVTIGVNNILTTDNYIDVAVLQGIQTTTAFVAAGDTYESFEYDNANIEDALYDVTVNDVAYTEVSDLNNSAAADKVYTFKNKPNLDGVEIQFGNDIFGKKLIVGDNVLLTYVDTLGIEGNVVSAGIVDTVDSTIYDIDLDVVPLYCTNLTSLDGGQDEEEVDNIRVNGVDTFQAGGKIVSKTDYEIAIKDYSYVLNAVVWGSYEQNILAGGDPWDAINILYNNVYISAYTPAGIQLTTDQRLAIASGINDDKPPEDIVIFQDVDFILMAFNITAFVESEDFVLSVVKADIISILQDTYDLEVTEFYDHIYDTAWKKIVSNVEGVAYHNSYIELIEFFTFDSEYVAAGDVLPIVDIVTTTVKIYASGTGTSGEYDLLGTDNGSGGFTPESGYDLTGSTIDYNTGAIGITVVSGLSEPWDNFSLKIYYQTEDANNDSNLVLNGINQIFKIEEITNVAASYQTTLGD